LDVSSRLRDGSTPSARDGLFLMQRVLRRLFLASFVALYGAVSLCGSALHALPGLDLDHVKVGSSSHGQDSAPPTSHHDDCPVCHFLAQGQLVFQGGPEIFTDAMWKEPAHNPPLAPPRPFRLASIPRAPPVA
jgi:Protein of unknown function (DUF2946)